MKPLEKAPWSPRTQPAMPAQPGSSDVCDAIERLRHRCSHLPALLLVSLACTSGWVAAQPAQPAQPAAPGEWPPGNPTVREAAIEPAGRAGLLLDQAPLDRAEALYKARRYDEAMSAFGVLAAAEDHPFAWLRIGNIWHRRGDVPMALDAYVRAQRAGQQTSSDQRLGVRATMNIVLLALDQAQLALETLRKHQGSASDPWAREIGLRMEELRAVLPGASPEPAAHLNLQAPR